MENPSQISVRTPIYCYGFSNGIHTCVTSYVHFTAINVILLLSLYIAKEC